jgi:hypothetical protein
MMAKPFLPAPLHGSNGRARRTRLLLKIRLHRGPERHLPKQQPCHAALTPAIAPTPEVEFVTAVLAAFVEVGKVDLDGRQLADAVSLLRAVWLHGFGCGNWSAGAAEGHLRTSRALLISKPVPGSPSPCLRARPRRSCKSFTMRPSRR